MHKPRIPVILDTDIGGDIDDTWALAMLLKSPELDTRLIVSDTGDTTYRAKLIAKFLEVAGRADTPVGIGLPHASDGPRERQAAWVADYDLTSYPGVVHEDGVQAIIDTVMHAIEPITLICIGPIPNIREALRREPAIAANAHFVGMHGSLNWHHHTNLCAGGDEGGIPEWNIVCDIPAAQAAFEAPWCSATITPLDTCAHVVLEGERYAAIRNSRDPLLMALLDNYRIWSPHNAKSNPETHSSVLFDTVAVYLAFSTRHLVMETMGLKVDDEGYLVRDASAPHIDVAIDWEDRDAWQDFLVERLLAPIV